MKTIGTALLALACAHGAMAQDTSEVRFHRVYLKNGNFIDGTLVRQSEQSVTLQMKTGEMSLRADQIDRVEYMKLRTVGEKPVAVPTAATAAPAAPAPPAPASIRKPGDASLDPMVTAGFSKEAVDRVNDLLSRFAKDKSETKYLVLDEIRSQGRETALLVAMNLGALTEEALSILGPILARMKLAEVHAPATKALSHRNPQVRRQAVSILSDLGAAESAKDLLALFKDPEPVVRVEAIDALVTLASRDALEPLAKLCLDPERTVRNKAIPSLSTLLRKLEQERDLFPQLARLLEESKGAVRADLAAAIAGTGHADAGGVLTPLLTDPDPQIRQSGASALRTLGSPATAEAIVARLPVEDDKWTRVHLAQAAQRTNARSAIAPLIVWLSDEDADIRTTAHQALRGLTAQNLDLNRQKWEDWYREKGDSFR